MFLLNDMHAEVRTEYTDFGFAGADIHSDSEIILLIRRDSVMTDFPKHHFFAFNTADVQIDSSKIFLYNAVFSKQHHDNEIGRQKLNS